MDKWVRDQEKRFSNPQRIEHYPKWDQMKLDGRDFKTLLKYAKPGMSFVDVGCNNGWAVNHLQEMGLDTLGIDLPAVIDHVTFNIKTQKVNLEKEFPEGQFDLMFCREVIEHIRNPNEVCERIINHLTDKGVLVMTAPCESMSKNCPQHVRIYAKQELDNLIQECGGTIIKAYTIPKQRIVVVKKDGI